MRSNAVELLGAHYDAAGRSADVVRILEKAIELDPIDNTKYRYDAGSRLAALHDDKAAMVHYAALLKSDPEAAVAQKRLHQLAQRSSNWEIYAIAIAAAAGATTEHTRRVELLADAARTRHDHLGDAKSAIELLKAATEVVGATPDELRPVARRLAELYGVANQPAQRLAILERLTEIEDSDTVRSALYAEAARLAEKLHETDRALALWQRRIDSDPTDTIAQNARIALLEQGGQWDELITALTNRAKGTTAGAAAQRAYWMRIAAIHRDHRRDLPAAIAAWQFVARAGDEAQRADAPPTPAGHVETAIGDAMVATRALADLYAESSQWSAMTALLERTGARDIVRIVAQLDRTGAAYRDHLGEPTRALAAFRNAIAVDPSDAPARAGLVALLDDAMTRAAAADALTQSYRRTDDHTGALDLLPARLADATDPRVRLSLLREAAALRLEHQGNTAGALADLAAAFPLAPRDALLEEQLRVLGTKANDHAAVAAAYAAAIATLADEPREAARLRVAHADLLANSLGDQAGALREYLAAATAEPSDRRAVSAVLKLAPAHQQWSEAATTLLSYIATRGRIDDELLNSLERSAFEGKAIDKLARALSDALAAADLPTAVAAALHARLATWHRDHLGAAPAAIASLREALSLGGDRASWLGELVALERNAGESREFLDALTRLGDSDPRNLDPLLEAAALAGKLGDRDQAITAYSQILGRAAAAWRGTATITSTRAPEEITRTSIDALVDLHRAAGNPRAAVDVLTSATRLPFSEDVRHAMRLRATDIATDEVGDRGLVIDMCRATLAAMPNDIAMMDRLGRLLEDDDRVAELLGLRQQQLHLEHDLDRKLALRLDISRLVGIVAERGGREAALRANLADRPGHEASIDAATALLASANQPRALADLLEEQAIKLETLHEPAAASRLWARFTQVTEHETKELDRAITGHRRIVALSPTPMVESLRALARLNGERGQPGQSVPWLESLLGIATGTERATITLQLARAHLAAQQVERAITALQANISDSEPAIEARQLLATLYRKNAAWEPLARHLTRSLPLIRDDKMSTLFAREAAAIYQDKLAAPDKAIPALQTALTLDPNDKELRSQLAVGLRTAGRLPEARALLGELIADFGRRRAPERAPLHVELARVAQAEGNFDEAIAETEQAAKMDVSNAAIQKELAEMARAAGQFEKAERTYRALLLVVRRQPPGDDENAVGQSEVLFELHTLAAQHNDTEQAKELLESAIDAATQSDSETRRLRRSLLAHGQTETLLRVLEMRLKATTDGMSQSRHHADMAAVLAEDPARSNDAIDAYVRALAAAPSRFELHDQARALAKRTRQIPRFVAAVETLVGKLRRKDDPPLVAELLMRTGETLEFDAGDADGSAAMYRRVETMGERLADAYYAQARIADKMGNAAEQARVLDKMLQMTESTTATATPEQIDSFYRLSEIFIATPSRRRQGIDLLERAFTAEPRWAQAGRVLKLAAATDISDERVLTMYERVARHGGDPDILLDFLEKRALAPGATTTQIREAINAATEVRNDARAEALLRRAVQTARDSEAGLADTTWAVLALIERRMAAGDLDEAKELLEDISELAPPATVDAMWRRLAAEGATRDDHRRLAAEIYETLRQANPSDRTIWQPLLSLYRELGDGDALSQVIGSTLPNLTDPVERNAIRIENARFLIAPLDRRRDAVEVLRDALLDDPDSLEAAALLEDTLRELGDTEGMADFLYGRFDDAQRRGNRTTTLDVAHRLGALLDASGSPDAATVWRSALMIAPDDIDVLRQVVAHLGDLDEPREAAVLMERLLGVETADRAPDLAGRLATAWELAGEDAGVQRALELAHQAAPEHQEIHDRLDAWYRKNGQWQELAELMTRDAARMTQAPAAAVERLREAASVYAGFLQQPAKAASVLRAARDLEPTSVELASELVAALVAAGELVLAQQAIGDALADVRGDDRLQLYLLRANLSQQLDDLGAAVDDLRAAYALHPERSVDVFIDALEQQRQAAHARGAFDIERATTLELASLLARHGDIERGRDLLVAWIERNETDADPLVMLCDIDASIEHWDGVVAGSTRLAYITEGTAQLAAGLRAAEAAARAGKPADAIPALELVHAAQPALNDVRNKLREFYELGGAHRELAGVLFADAEHSEDVDFRFATYRRAAELYLHHANDAAAAAPAAKMALAMNPEDHDVSMLYVDVLLGTNQIAEAAAGLETSIAAQKKRTPELAMMQQRMGRLCAMQDDRDGQLNWLKKAFDVDRKNAEVAAELAELATEMGDYELALKPLRAITLMENPLPLTRPMALLREAKIEHMRGNRAKAELWAKKALREDPAFGDAQHFLDELAGS